MDKILLVEAHQMNLTQLARHWVCQEYLALMAVDSVQDSLIAHTISWEQEQYREVGCKDKDNKTQPVEFTQLPAQIPALLVQETTP